MSAINKLNKLDRPREKIAQLGPEHLSDIELLAAMLGSGGKNKKVLALSKSVLELLNNNSVIKINDLLKISGIGLAQASKIIAAKEFFYRRNIYRGQTIKKAEDAFLSIKHLSHKQQENFISLTLNGAQELIEVRVITIGLLDQVQVHPRELFADAIVERASAIIIAHNHPSQSLTPSNADIKLTKDLRKAGRILGIPILDHIIFNACDFFSFKEQGLFT